MSRPLKLYQLAANPEPVNSCCICIPIPDEPTHRQNFLGALFTLTVWIEYERDEDRTAKKMADVWKEVYQCVLEELEGI